MLNKKTNNNNNSEKAKIKTFLTINDLRDKDYSNKDLAPNERLALKNFDRYRISVLNSQVTEDAFHKKYLQLQVMANLNPFEEFLKECYFT